MRDGRLCSEPGKRALRQPRPNHWLHGRVVAAPGDNETSNG